MNYTNSSMLQIACVPYNYNVKDLQGEWLLTYTRSLTLNKNCYIHLLQTSALPFHFSSLPETRVLYKDNGLCFLLIRRFGHLKGHACEEQQNVVFKCVDFSGELWESKSIEVISGNGCVKENTTVISLLYSLNPSSYWCEVG